MDIVSIGKYIMMQPKQFLKFRLKIIFIKNVKQLKECRLGIIVNPPPPIVVNNIIYGCLENK